MSLRFRFLLLTGLFLAMVMAIGWCALISMNRLDRDLLSQHSRSFESEVHAVSAQVALTAQAKEWQGLVSSEMTPGERRSRWLAFEQEESELRRRLGLLMSGLPLDAEASRLAAAFLREHRERGDRYREAYQVLEMGGPEARQRAQELIENGAEAPVETFDRIVLTLSAERQSMQARIDLSKVRNVAYTAISIGGAVFIAFLVVVFLTSRWVNRPLHQIIKQADRIASGEFERRDAPSNSTDVVKLQRALNKMASSLKVGYEYFQSVNVELEQARDEALDASRLKSEFLANVSHEMRTPLNGVIGMGELLMETELNREQTTMASIMRSSGKTLLAVINDLLDFSKIEADHIELQEVDFELEGVLEESILVVAPRVDANKVALGFVVEGSVPARVNGDPLRLKQVLINLLSNASKFTERGEISVRVRHLLSTGEGTRLEFAVKDTGIGIPVETQELIFEAFRQVDGSATREHTGTGLGLAITKRLVTMMEGSIRVESEVGEGSVFVAEVFLANANTQTGGDCATSTDLEGKKVLIVDDHAINREVLSLRFGRWGCWTKTVASGWEALQVLERDKDFDLILSDHQMPKMNGHQFANHLSGDVRWAGIPRVLLTSMAPGLGMEKNPDGLFSAVATKPIIKQALFDVVTGVLATPASRQTKTMSGKQSGTRKTDRSKVELNARILVAEDDPMNRKYMSLLLRKAGFQHDLVENGEQAIEAVATADYDLILMDCSMPVMDGYEATREIRERGSDGRMPYIIGLTGHTGKGAEKRCLESGMDHYLSKPIEPTRLCDELREVLAVKLDS